MFFFSNTFFYQKIVSNKKESIIKEEIIDYLKKPIYNFHINNENGSVNLEKTISSFFKKEFFFENLLIYSSFEKVNNESSKLYFLKKHQYDAIKEIKKSIYKRFLEYHNIWNPDKYKWWYIHHSTWSWKTLTSFKVIELIIKWYFKDVIPEEYKPDKILFVVDRVNLNNQTIDEFRRFNGNDIKNEFATARSKKDLNRLLNNEETKAIITTIQKAKDIDIAGVRGKNFILFFDECHRSQSGSFHNDLKGIFSQAKSFLIFGFTWTPIYEENAPDEIIDEDWKIIKLKTSKEIFWNELHTYNIYDAVKDWTVLDFLYIFTPTAEIDENLEISTNNVVNQKEYEKKIIENDARISLVTTKILRKYNTLTKNWRFNAMFAVDSKSMAKKYYMEFKKQCKILWIWKDKFRFSTIFSIDENKTKTNELTQDEIFMDEVRKDFAETFNEWKIEKNKEFENVVIRYMKQKKLHLVIVVDKLLTWFDSPETNTLFIDKKLRQATTIVQTISRVNRLSKNNPKDKEKGIVCSFQNFKDKKNLNDFLLFFTNNKDEELVLNLSDEFIKSKKDEFEGLKMKISDILTPIKIKIWNIYSSDDIEPLLNNQIQELLDLYKDLNKNIKYLSYASPEVYDEAVDFLKSLGFGDIEKKLNHLYQRNKSNEETKVPEWIKFTLWEEKVLHVTKESLTEDTLKTFYEKTLESNSSEMKSIPKSYNNNISDENEYDNEKKDTFNDYAKEKCFTVNEADVIKDIMLRIGENYNWNIPKEWVKRTFFKFFPYKLREDIIENFKNIAPNHLEQIEGKIMEALRQDKVSVLEEWYDSLANYSNMLSQDTSKEVLEKGKRLFYTYTWIYAQFAEK